MTDNGFKIISKEQVGIVVSWLGYIQQTRLALELEGGTGHEAFCQVLQKAADAIYRVMAELPPA